MALSKNSINFIIDGKRTEYRRNKKIGFVNDFLYYSHFHDYRFIRFMVHFITGICICYAIYNFVWVKLNFASNSVIKMVYKWCFIVGASTAYAWFPAVRCVLLCILLGSLSKYGQGIFTVQTVEWLREGPITNMIGNTREVMRSITCNLELQTKIQFNRITLATGPIEAMIEHYFDKATIFGRKIVRTLKALLDPIAAELNRQRDSEDIGIDAVIGKIETMARQADASKGIDRVVNKSKTALQNTEQIDWKKIRIERLTRACKEIFAKAEIKCEELTMGMENKCRQKIFWPLNLACKKLNIISLCDPSELMSYVDNACNFTKMEELNVDLVPPNIQEHMEQIKNITKYLKDQLRLNLHFEAIHFPRLLRIHAISEIKTIVKGIYKIVAEVSIIVQDCLSLLTIILICIVAKSVIGLMDNYLNNLDFKNNFITPYFWKIDKKRKELGKLYLGRIEPAEKKEFNLSRISSPPTSDEFDSSKYAFYKWLVLTIAVVIVCLFDFLFYEFLQICSKHDNFTHNFTGSHNIVIEINGTGPIAQLMRDLLNFKYEQRIDQSVNNTECRLQPTLTDDMHYWKLGLILVGILCFQVIFNFILRRVMTIGLFGFTFFEQYKKRALHLYEKVIKFRLEKRQEQTRRLKDTIIREQCYRRILKKYPTGDEAWDFNPPKFLGYIISLEECLLCQAKFRKRKLLSCEKCNVHFCQLCSEYLGSECQSCILIHQMGFAEQTSIENKIEENAESENEAPQQNNNNVVKESTEKYLRHRKT